MIALPLVVSFSGYSALAYLFYIRWTDMPGKIARHISRACTSSCSTSGTSTSFTTSCSPKTCSAWAVSSGSAATTGIIDRFGPDGVSDLVARSAKRLGTVQTGYLYHYAFAMIIGIAILVSWFVVGGGK